MKERVATWGVIVSGVTLLAVIFFLVLCPQYAHGQSADLPVAPPVFGEDPQPLEVEAPAPPGDDPRDTPPPQIWGEVIDAETDSIAFVIDCSGSMDGFPESMTTADGRLKRGSRYERARAELIRSIRGLSESFEFQVTGYDCAVASAFPQPVEATQANKQRAEAWLSEICTRDGEYYTRLGQKVFGTGTGTGPATAYGLSWRENLSVVLLTDGEPNCGAPQIEGHRRMIRSANTQGARIDVFGIAAAGTWRLFCQNVAGDSGGSYYDVP